jgi:hypothetical protein
MLSSREFRHRQCGLHRTRGGYFSNTQLNVRVSRQGVLGHQLLGNSSRKSLFYTALDVDLGKLVKLKLWAHAQFLALSIAAPYPRVIAR